MSQKSGNVAVFWDYENCPAPAGISGYAIANRISALARSFGSVNVFKAYLEISDQSRSSLRSELQSSGVSLVDCPHNGRKDVADKMILVDMLSYAIDNPAPSTIFLITGDRDFAYALSILKNRHYRVILVKRPDTHLSLTFQACICFDWVLDVVHQAENPSSQAEQSPQRRPYQRHRQSDFLSNVSASRPWPHSATDNPTRTDIEETVDIVHLLHGGTSGREHLAKQEHPQVSTATYESPRQDREVSSSPGQLSLSTSGDSTSNSALGQEKPQETSLYALRHKSTQSEPSSTALPKNILPKHNSHFRSRSADIGDAKAHTGKFSEFLEPTKEDGIPYISPISSPFIFPPPTLPMTLDLTAPRRTVVEERGKSAKAMRSPDTPPMSVEELAGRFVNKEQGIHVSLMSPSSANPAISFPSSKSSTSGPTTVGPVKHGIENPLAPRNAKPFNPRTSSQTHSGSEATGLLNTPIVVPPNFAILVEALQWQIAQGVFQPFRNVIAERICKKGTTYQKAGVSSFREYSLLAEKAGIIEMGGKGGKDWVRLKPVWHSVHVLAPTIPTIC